MSTTHPKDQFQIGDIVIYVDIGVVSIVDGYLWQETVGVLPKVIGYILTAGCTVPFDALRLYNNELKERDTKRRSH